MELAGGCTRIPFFPGGVRVEGLFGYSTRSEEFAGAQERRIRLPVDPVSALGRDVLSNISGTSGQAILDAILLWPARSPRTGANLSSLAEKPAEQDGPDSGWRLPAGASVHLNISHARTNRLDSEARKTLQTLQVASQLVKPRLVQLINMPPPSDLTFDQPCFLEDAQRLRDGRPGNFRQRPTRFSRRVDDAVYVGNEPGLHPKGIDDTAPRRTLEGGGYKMVRHVLMVSICLRIINSAVELAHFFLRYGLGRSQRQDSVSIASTAAHFFLRRRTPGCTSTAR